MSDYSITVKKSQIRKLENFFNNTPRQIPKVLSRAINKTTSAARVKAVREISADTKLKKKFIYQRGKTNRPIIVKNATYKTLEAHILISQKRIPLSRFNAVQRKTGVSYNLGRGRTTAKGSFLRKVYGKSGAKYGRDIMGWEGHEAVLKRRTKKPHPLMELYGPSLGRVFTKAAGILRRTIKEANKKLAQEIDRQIEVLIQQQLKRKAG